VEKARDLKDTVKLREARETLAGRFPLPPEEWAKWIADEISNDVKGAFTLSSRALDDYVTIDLCVLHIQCAIQCTYLPSAHPVESQTLVRSAYQKALEFSKYHFGALSVWTEAIEYEKSLWNALVDQAKETEEEQVQLQLMMMADDEEDIIRNLFQSALRTPLAEHTVLLNAYSEWEASVKEEEEEEEEAEVMEKAIVEHHRIQNAFEKLYLKFELSLSENQGTFLDPNYDLYPIWREYASLALSNGNRDLAKTVYNRAISDGFFLLQELWTCYLDAVGLVCPATTRKVLNRARRNVSWVGYFHSQYLISLEATTSIEKDNVNDFLLEVEEAVAYGFSFGLSGAEGYFIHREYLLLLHRLTRRNLSSAVKEKFEQEKESAQDYMVNAAKHHRHDATTLSLCEISFVSLRLLLAEMAIEEKDLDNVCSFMESILDGPAKRVGNHWLSYIGFHVRLGADYKVISSLYQRACSAVYQDIERVMEEWEKFERILGTPSSILSADAAIRKKRLSVQSYYASIAERKAKRGKKEKKEKKQGKGGKGKGGKESAEKEKKKKRGGEEESEGGKGKKRKRGEREVGVASEREVKKRKVGDSNGGGTDVELEKELERKEEAVRSLKEEKRQQDEEVLQKLEEQKVKVSVYYTVMLKGLPNVTKENDLEILSKKAKVFPSQFRIVVNDTGKCRGIGYMDFTTKIAAKQSIRKLKRASGRVEPSVCSTTLSTGLVASPSDAHIHTDEKTLYISNLPNSITVVALYQLFSPMGALKEIRLVLDRKGALKGFGYVEYLTYESLEKALKLNGDILLDRKLRGMELHMF